MNCDEIMHTHILFCGIRRYLENEFLEKVWEEKFNSFFTDYDKYRVNPLKINKSQKEQKNAMFILGKCIIDFMNFEYANNGKKSKIEPAILTSKEYVALTAV